jgi:argininosuccinate lyase
MKMWSGRFETPVEASFDRWQRSFPYDRRLLPYEVASSKAHAEALAQAGVLSAPELSAILGALGRILSEGVPGDTDATIEDVHHFVERSVVEQIADVGMKLHTGRSRNELIATDLRLYTRDSIDHIHSRTAALIEALVAQAEKAGMAAMPAYTHAQRAEPVLFAHWLLAYAEMFLRDIDRLQSCRERLNECPLGSGAVAGTIVAVDRQGIARKLGFDGPTANSMDATSDRDFAIEFVQHASLLAGHMSRLAEDLILFSSNEYGFVHLPDAYCTGSSAMPQKKNPDALELLRAHSGRMLGNAVALTTTIKGLPLSYNKDLQETQMPLFDTVGRTLAILEVATGCLRGLEIDVPRMRIAATRGGMNALAAAAFLARRGVPFRKAHELIGRAVQLSLSKKCELEELSTEDLRQCEIDVPPDQFRAALSLDAVLALHDVEGGTAPARVAAAIANVRERLDSMRDDTEAKIERS